uniref:Cyclin B n=1 Tax=Peronospora matthiolae TaxID=2874970 RepID=A0AAV1TDB1_9STRA
MPLPHASVHLNNENEMPTDLHASRLGKRQISRDVPDGGNPEKRPRYTKTQSHTSSTGGSRRSAMGNVTNRRCALGDVTNRINIKKSSVSASMGSSVANAGALSKKAILASKRSLSDISAKSSSVRNANVNASKRNFRNVTLSSRHAGAMSSSTVTLGSCSSSSVINRMSRPLPVVTPTGTLGSMRSMEKILPADDIIQPTPESYNHDIDSEDKNDPTACWQYAEDITKYHLEAEKKSKISSSYMARQSDVNPKMRAILVDWLIDVHYKYGLLSQTLHIAVLLIDHYLEKDLTIGRQRLQLVGVSAMLIASKYEEIYPPQAEDFAKITDNAFTRDEVVQMEAKILATISYRVTFPTAFQFMKRFLKASRSCDDRVEHFAHYAIDRSLQEYKLIKYLPSTIAASAVHIARSQMLDFPVWSSTLEHHSSYSERSLDPCVDDMKEMLRNTSKCVGWMAKLTAARRKFSKERFMGVAADPLGFGESA